MLQSVESFIQYFAGIRRRTLNFAQAIPPTQIEWSPETAEFTCGDILRHLAALEIMTVSAVVDGHWPAYPGHGSEMAGGLEEILNLMETSHNQAMERLRTIQDTVLNQRRPAIAGQPTKAWQLLMAMVEHEIHHRSQLASYLKLMGVQPPQIFGLGVEEVIVLSQQQAGDQPPMSA